jgi:hypothetical protein
MGPTAKEDPSACRWRGHGRWRDTGQIHQRAAARAGSPGGCGSRTSPSRSPQGVASASIADSSRLVKVVPRRSDHVLSDGPQRRRQLVGEYGLTCTVDAIDRDEGAAAVGSRHDTPSHEIEDGASRIAEPVDLHALMFSAGHVDGRGRAPLHTASVPIRSAARVAATTSPDHSLGLVVSPLLEQRDERRHVVGSRWPDKHAGSVAPAAHAIRRTAGLHHPGSASSGFRKRIQPRRGCGSR